MPARLGSIPVIDTQTYSITYDIPIPGTSSPYGIAICPQYVAEGVYLIPPEQAKEGGRGETVAYQETLFNNSGITETFDLQALDNQWDTQFSTDPIGPLPNGETAIFTITVTVPVDAPWYGTDNATILATGVTSPSLTAEAEITTTAFAPAQIGVEPNNLESTQVIGSVTTQTMTISNGEGITLTYDIYEGTFPGNVASMHMNETQGSTTFYDTSGYGNNATCSGDTCPVAGIPGAIGTALSFDGLEDLIQIPHNAEFDQIEDQDKVSIAAWVWINEWYNGNLFTIINQYDSASDDGWEFYLNPDTIAFSNRMYEASGCSFNFNTGEWYYVAVGYDRNLETIQFYVNGSQICNNSYSGDILDTVGDPMYIGYGPSGGDEYANGKIDELFVFNRALSSEEIMVIYQGGLSGDAPWLSVDPVSGIVPTNGLTPVQVTFDAMDLQPDIYTTTLYVVSNDPLTPIVEIPVTLTVIAVPPKSATHWS